MHPAEDQIQKERIVRKLCKTMEWEENKNTKLYHLPKRRLMELSVIYTYLLEEKSYQQIANEHRISKRKVQSIITGK